MKKFIIKGFLFISIFFIGITCFLYLGKIFYLNEGYALWKSKIDYIKNSKENRNIILGDSKAVAGMIPTVIQNDFYNLAISAGTPIESYFQLQNYLHNNQKPKKIILSYSAFHIKKEEVFFERTLKSNFLTYNQLVNVFEVINDKKEDLQGNKLTDRNFIKTKTKSVLTWDNFIYFYRKDLKGFMSNPIRYRKNNILYNEINNNFGQFYFGKEDRAKKITIEVAYEDFEASKVIKYYLEQTIQLALKNNIKVYYVNAPFSELSYNSFKPGFVSGYSAYMKDLQDKYPEVIWYSDLFAYPNDFFGDDAHLNKKGAIKFSNFIKGVIEHKQEDKEFK